MVTEKAYKGAFSSISMLVLSHPSKMYVQYAKIWPNSQLAHEFLVDCSGGHFSTSLYENRLNDAWIHADSKNKERMSYLGFRDYSAETVV